MRQISRYRSVLMGLASLWIYYFHVFPTSLIEQFHRPTMIETYFHDLGFCGVDIFLVLSGFGLYYALSAHPVENLRDYGTFVCRRLSRIYRVFFPVTVVIALVDRWTVGEFFGKLTGVYQLATNVYNYLWYVPCIVIFYLLVPGYFALLRRCPKKGAMTAGAVALCFCVNLLLKGHVREDLYAILNRVPVFLVGLYFGDHSQSGKRLNGLAYGACAAVLAVGLVYSYAQARMWVPEVYPCFSAQINLLIAPPLVLLLSRGMEAASRWKFPGPLQTIKHAVGTLFAALGSISLEFYVVQEWVCTKTQNSGTLLALAQYNGWGQQLLCLVLTVVAAVGLHWVAGRLQKLRRSEGASC